MNANRFIHLEHLEGRPPSTAETVRFHVHLDLHQVCCFTAGSGEVIAADARMTLDAPCVLVIPAGVTHGVLDVARCRGLILTFSDDHLARLSRNEPAFQAMYAGGAWSVPVQDDFVPAALHRIGHELAWSGQGRATTIDAYLSALQVELLRLYRQTRGSRHAANERQGACDPQAARSAHAQLVARFRGLVETHFRQTRSIATYAGWLGVTGNRLREACLAVAGRCPSEIINERIALEASRIMHYSDLPIAEVGRKLGFGDPAYFSRFFSKVFAVPPGQFRRDAQRGSTVPCAPRPQTARITFSGSSRNGEAGLTGN